MNISSVYPVIMTDEVAATASFYKRYFGFEYSYETDWYVSMHCDGPRRGWELAVLCFDHETVPVDYQRKCQGMLVNVEVEDAAEVYERLVLSGPLKAVRELKDEEFGQRHFIVEDPSGNLVDVIQNIEPSEREKSNYTLG